MKKLISCEFNMDTACVEMEFSDGTRLDIDCIISHLKRKPVPPNISDIY